MASIIDLERGKAIRRRRFLDFACVACERASDYPQFFYCVDDSEHYVVCHKCFAKLAPELRKVLQQCRA